MPNFDLSDSGGIGLVLLRGIVNVAVLMVFGTAVLRALVAPAGLRHLPLEQASNWRRRLRRLNQWLCLAALPLLGLWLVFVARSLADATDWADTENAIGIVLGGTSFGHVIIGEAAALGVLAAALGMGDRFGDIVALLSATALVGLQSCHGHAFSMGDAGLYLVTALHLLAAGAWLGGLPALFWLVCRLQPGAATALGRAFSPLGQVMVLLIAVTALIQGLVMIQTLHNLVATAYGWTALLKLLLFGLLLALACFNRFYALGRETAEAGRRVLLRGLGCEILAGLAVILAAGLLASLPPAMRM
ncbi:MAG TPA: CopD family protein [Acidisoma sp.]|jgi:putative copper export protein|nr:CopD family protein [Acidisoma sp.]